MLVAAAGALGGQAGACQQIPLDLARLTISEAIRVGLPPALHLALVCAESKFNPQALSPKGAIGLGQLMPGTASDLGVRNPWDPQQNLNGSARYLRAQLVTFKGSIPLALAAYNAGAGNVIKAGGIPNFSETVGYVQKIVTLAPLFEQVWRGWYGAAATAGPSLPVTAFMPAASLSGNARAAQTVAPQPAQASAAPVLTQVAPIMLPGRSAAVQATPGQQPAQQGQEAPGTARQVSQVPLVPQAAAQTRQGPAQATVQQTAQGAAPVTGMQLGRAPVQKGQQSLQTGGTQATGTAQTGVSTPTGPVMVQVAAVIMNQQVAQTSP